MSLRAGRATSVMVLGLALACARTPPLTTLAGKSDFADGIRTVFFAITGVDTVILLLVIALLALGMFRYSKRSGLGTEVSPRTQLRLETAWTIGPALILLAIAIPSVRMTFRTQPAVPPADALVVHVVARQWWWQADYPALGIVTANEIHVPVGRPLRFRLDSGDVIHSFWVPQLGGKRDVIPGQTNEIVLVARVPGTYLGVCGEFCGTSHANMRFRVVVDTPEEFAAWTARQQAPPVVLAGGATDALAAGARIYAGSTCTPCHTIGDASVGRLGPDLTHFASRRTFAGGTLENTPDNLAAWLRDPPALKPGVGMPRLGLREAEIAPLVAYLESLE
jgi:cytochrome c oxidase subunit 2